MTYYLYANSCFIGNIFLMETWHQVCRLKFCEEKHPLKLFDSLKLLGYFNQWNLSCTSKLVRLGYFSKEIQFDHLSSWVKSVRGMPLWDLHTAVLQLAKNCFQDIPIGSKWIQIMACCFFLFFQKQQQILKSAVLIILLFILSVVVFFFICTGTRTVSANSSNTGVWFQ